MSDADKREYSRGFVFEFAGIRVLAKSVPSDPKGGIYVLTSNILKYKLVKMIKVYSRRFGKEDPVRDAAILLHTINRLRGKALIPVGVYYFSTHKEADRWMIRQIASTHARLKSRT